MKCVVYATTRKEGKSLHRVIKGTFSSRCGWAEHQGPFESIVPISSNDISRLASDVVRAKRHQPKYHSTTFTIVEVEDTTNPPDFNNISDEYKIVTIT